MSSSEPLRGFNLDCTGGNTSISPRREWGRFTLGLVTLQRLELNWTQRGCLSINWHLMCLDFQIRVHPMYYIFIVHISLVLIFTISSFSIWVLVQKGHLQRLWVQVLPPDPSYPCWKIVVLYGGSGNKMWCRKVLNSGRLRFHNAYIVRASFPGSRPATAWGPGNEAAATCMWRLSSSTAHAQWQHSRDPPPLVFVGAFVFSRTSRSTTFLWHCRRTFVSFNLRVEAKMDLNKISYYPFMGELLRA